MSEHPPSDDAKPIPAEVSEFDPAPSAGRTGQGSSRSTDAGETPRLDWRRLLAALLLVGLADVTIYRGNGYAGLAVFFAVTPFLLCWGTFRPTRRTDVAVVGAMLLLLAARLVWCGSVLQATLGFALLFALGVTLSGLCPYVLETFLFATHSLVAGVVGLVEQARTIGSVGKSRGRIRLLAVAIPLAALLVFFALFLRANPDLWNSVACNLRYVFSSLHDWFDRYGPWPSEVFFWLFVLVLATGVLRPTVRVTIWTETRPAAEQDAQVMEGSRRAVLYTPFRNTLIAVICLFAVYLIFEFSTLWFKEFEEGFHYSGYAHRGAFWLTVALALATLVLSLVFRGRILKDERLPRLRSLAWIWSLENFLLAVAVYHRLTIYVGFNGMTFMRTIGFFGISVVVVGFVLVLRKIAANRDFVWLVRRQLWALAVSVYLFAITPVDALVMNYNVRRILHGDPAPSVQISVHPIDAAGFMELTPLLDCENEIIREGVRALLSKRYDQARQYEENVEKDGWTAFQWSDRQLLRRFRSLKTRLTDYVDATERERNWEAFADYAYQWY